MKMFVWQGHYRAFEARILPMLALSPNEIRVVNHPEDIRGMRPYDPCMFVFEGHRDELPTHMQRILVEDGWCVLKFDDRLDRARYYEEQGKRK